MKIIRTGIFGVNTYIVPLCENKVFVVDPADNKISNDEGKIVRELKKDKLDCAAILLTHTHFDHILGITNLKNEFPDAVIAVHNDEKSELNGNAPGPMNKFLLDFFGMNENLEIFDELQKIPVAEKFFNGGERLSVLFENADENLKNAANQWKIISTPGHSPGSVCFYNKDQKVLIAGDTIFDYGGYGRTDMYGGNEALILRTINKLKTELPPDTKVFPGHESFGFTLN